MATLQEVYEEFVKTGRVTIESSNVEITGDVVIDTLPEDISETEVTKEIEAETDNTQNFEKINEMISNAKVSFDQKTGILTLQSENQEMPSLVVDLTKSEYKLM